MMTIGHLASCTSISHWEVEPIIICMTLVIADILEIVFSLLLRF